MYNRLIIYILSILYPLKFLSRFIKTPLLFIKIGVLFIKIPLLFISKKSFWRTSLATFGHSQAKPLSAHWYFIQ
jgi:hypothetical protein